MSKILTATTLQSMKYKDFVWPNNPETTEFQCDRTYVKHKYPELDGIDIEDMGVDAIMITGNGAFIGPSAYDQWLLLWNTYISHGPGEFYHPIFTNVSQALMTKFTGKAQPYDQYIEYSVEFVAYNAPAIQMDPVAQAVSEQESTDNSNIDVGDTVVCGDAYAYYTSYGDDPHTANMSGRRLTVTYTAYSNPYPIHVGSYGWMRLEDVSKVGGGDSSYSDATVYTVQSGDCLSVICDRYGADWRTVASYNGIKNPDLIYPGQQITIV